MLPKGCVCLMQKLFFQTNKQTKQWEGILQCQKARMLPTINEVGQDTAVSLKELPLDRAVRM